MERVRGAGGRAVKTTVEQTHARVGDRISVCSSGAASICQRALMTIIGHTIHTRVPLRGPAPGPAKSQMSVQVDRTLRKGLGWVDLCGRARFNRVTDGPEKGSQLRSYRGSRYGLSFAHSHQPATSRAQTQLSLPGDRPYDR